jgi:hypothetical protein
MPPPLLPFLLAAATRPAGYLPAPWYMRWLEAMPLWALVLTGCVATLLYLLKKPVETFVAKLFDEFTERLKRSSKEPASAADLARKARKAVVLEQAAEKLRVKIDCDHVSVYGCQNGEYLRSGEGIDKFVMQAEATEGDHGRYMDVERVVFAQDIPRTVLALEEQPYLLLWERHCDDWKVNKLMKERGYTSSIAVFIRRPLRPGSSEMGVIGMYVLSWYTCEVYRPDQASALPATHSGPQRLLDEPLEQMLRDYAQEFSFSM